MDAGSNGQGLRLSGLDEETRRELGAAVRELRAEQRLTLAALSALVGVSASAISQIERGATEPSLGTLWKLGKALNASLFDFFTRQKEPAVEVTRAAERTLVQSDRFRYEVVARSMERTIDLFFLRIAGGNQPIREPSTHDGEECGVVLEGELDVVVDGETHRLGEGDGIWFLSSQPHTFRPANRRASLSVWADTTPAHRKPGKTAEFFLAVGTPNDREANHR